MERNLPRKSYGFHGNQFMTGGLSWIKAQSFPNSTYIIPFKR